MTWEKFYETITDNTVTDEDILRNMTRLSSFGPADEVCEIVFEFISDENAGKFLRFAREKGVRFSMKNLLNVKDDIDQETFDDLIRSAPRKMSRADFEEVEFFLDDETRAQVLAASHLSSAGEGTNQDFSDSRDGRDEEDGEEKISKFKPEISLPKTPAKRNYSQQESGASSWSSLKKSTWFQIVLTLAVLAVVIVIVAFILVVPGWIADPSTAPEWAREAGLIGACIIFFPAIIWAIIL